MDASNWIQVGILVTLAVTMAGVFWYAAEAKRQAAATQHIAEASLRPAIEQYLPDEPPIYTRSLVLKYQNYGNGPAVNIKWTVMPSGEIQERAGMSCHGTEGQVTFQLDGTMTPEDVLAEYYDLFGKRWASVLSLEAEDGVLRNGRTTHLEGLLDNRDMGRDFYTRLTPPRR